MLQQILYDFRVTQGIVATEEVKRRWGQRRVPERVDARVEVVHSLLFEHVEVKKAGVLHQVLKTREQVLTHPWSATKQMCINS